MITIEQYAQEVKKMRDLQTRYFPYFQARSTGAKSQERKVDNLTNEILLAQ